MGEFAKTVSRSGVVCLMVCGAPLAHRTADLAHALTAGGWEVRLVGTPASAEWLDPVALAREGYPPRFEFRSPNGERTLGADPDALIIAPATFNTLNKIAAGIADNYAVATACALIGTRQPVVAVPMVNNKLWGHPVWEATLATLVGSGVRLLDIATGASVPKGVLSGTGESVVASFDPAWVVRMLGNRLT